MVLIAVLEMLVVPGSNNDKISNFLENLVKLLVNVGCLGCFRLSTALNSFDMVLH